MTLVQLGARGASFISAYNYSRGFAKGISETLKFRAPSTTSLYTPLCILKEQSSHERHECHAAIVSVRIRSSE